MVTLSVIKADVGGFVGHSSVHPDLETAAREQLDAARESGLRIEFHVTHCGDDLQLIMTHDRGVDDEAIHRLAWDTFVAGTTVAKRLKLYGIGQGLLAVRSVDGLPHSQTLAGGAREVVAQEHNRD